MCRTRVMSNINGPEVSGSRGNFAFTTLNLPKLAIEAQGDIEKFYKLFDKYVKLSKKYLEYRRSIIAQKKVKNFPFLLGQHVWLDSERLGPEDFVAPLLKHCSYSIGFCGLAECLVSLIGKHHGESEEAQKLGLNIVQRLRDWCDKFTKQTHENFTCFASPAESTAGAFAKANQKQYGLIPGVTDRDYETNSFHVPVYCNISAFDKIKIEAPYHRICNAGSISYIEFPGDPLKNLSAFEKIVRTMIDSDMGYISINHPVDRCAKCGYTGIIDNACPKCGNTEIQNHEEIVPRCSC